MTKDGQWRVRMAVFELIADLALLRDKENNPIFKDAWVKTLQPIFFGYMTNTAASVRMKGVEKVAALAKEFGSDWASE